MERSSSVSCAQSVTVGLVRSTRAHSCLHFLYVLEPCDNRSKMFLNFEVVGVFGASAIISFFVSAALLLMFAAKRGLLRIGSRRKASPSLLPQNFNAPILVPVELMPLKTDKLHSIAV